MNQKKPNLKEKLINLYHTRLKTLFIGAGSVIGFIVVAAILLGLIESKDSPSQFIKSSVNTQVERSIFQQAQEYVELENGVYIGELSKGVIDGEGNFFFDTGYAYQGSFKKGKLKGEGTLTIPKLGTYVGSFVDNKRQGQGTFTWENGDVLTCEWKDDKPEGNVIKSFSDGSEFKGTISSGSADGTYTTVVKDIKYVYTVSNNKLTNVSFTTSKNVQCNGPFSDGKLNGNCTITYSDGSKYEGSIENNKRKGSGTYTWSDGSSYSGEWKDDKMSGYGTFTWGYSNSLKGNWKNNAPDGSMNLSYQSKTYTATFSNGKCQKITV